MRRQNIYIQPYDWNVVVYYDIDLDYMPLIASELHKISMDEEYIHQAYDTLRKPNTGLTYTNKDKRSTVAVIGKTTSADEFADTYDHEKGHIVRHIAEANNLHPYSEEEQYLAGHLSRIMFDDAKHYMCEECRNKNFALRKSYENISRN